MVVQRHLAGPAPPSRRPGIERGADNPRPRSRMSPDLPPRGPGPRERLGNLLLGLGQVTSTGGDRAQAWIPALLEELGEPFLIATHNRLTRHQPKTLTSIPANQDLASRPRGDLPQSTCAKPNENTADALPLFGYRPHPDAFTTSRRYAFDRDAAPSIPAPNMTNLRFWRAHQISALMKLGCLVVLAGEFSASASGDRGGETAATNTRPGPSEVPVGDGPAVASLAT